MDQVASRYLTAATALAAAGLVGVVPIATPALPDIQVRAVGLAANAADLADAQINALYDHIQQEFSGGVDLSPEIGAGQLPADGGDAALGGIGDAVFNGDDVTLDDNAVTDIVGGGFDPGLLDEGAVAAVSAPDVYTLGGTGSVGALNLNENIVAAATNFFALSAVDLLPAMQAAYQGFTSGVIAAELALNSALVGSQLDTVEQFFGTDSITNDFVSWILSVNNASLAQTEIALNSLLGAQFDPALIHGSLVDGLNADGFTLGDWAALLGVSPDELSQFIAYFEGSDLFAALSGLDWTSLFPGLF